ncbi:MAG: hypothetical protein LQ342_004218 [Letrouitia transgressa]|nr:MAG: hypothetical protein LQ342_004218 [Letrouitia transgressa]
MLGVVAEIENLRTRYGLKYIVSKDSVVPAHPQRTYERFLANQIKIPVVNVTSRIRALAFFPDEDRSPSTDNDSYVETIEKGRASMKFMMKCRWIISDGKRFEELVRLIRKMNKLLNGLVPDKVVPHLITGMETSILSDTSTNRLGSLMSAAANRYPMLGVASELRSRVDRFEPTSRTPPVGSFGPLRDLSIKSWELDLRPVPKNGPKTRTIAVYKPSDGRAREVLVEWKSFIKSLNRATRESTLRRTDNLARVLQKQPNSQARVAFRRLDCIGYYVTDSIAGYVFELPVGTNANYQPISLLSLLREAPNDDEKHEENDTSIDMPPLEKRFALAKALCISIYCLHLGELVHKGIRPQNVIFFHPESGTDIDLADPYVTGFDHSRPDGPDDPTITQTAISSEDDLYRHPDYNTSTSRRSTKLHDIYSLGLLLLEVAMWFKLKALVQEADEVDVKTYLSSDNSPIDELDTIMGSRYQAIVERCIRGNFDVDIIDPNSAGALQRLFLDQIVLEMAKCNV